MINLCDTNELYLILQAVDSFRELQNGVEGKKLYRMKNKEWDK